MKLGALRFNFFLILMNLGLKLNACKWLLCTLLDIAAVDIALFCVIKADSP